MTTTTLKWMILQELQERELNPLTGHFSNKEQIFERLIEPIKADFTTFQGPTANSGYLIIYDEEEEFGLATKSSYENKKLGYLIGFYGSFVDTLDNM